MLFMLMGPYCKFDAPSVTGPKGSDASGKNSCFVTELSRITSENIPYHPLGQNSNTLAKTLLVNCGVPVAKPVIESPGWDSRFCDMTYFKSNR